LDSYKNFFEDFNLKKLEYIELEKSDEILNTVGLIFPPIEMVSEMINNNSSEESALIKKSKDDVSPGDICYVFTDDVYECGMFTATAESVLKSSLGMAFLDHTNTLRVVDRDFKYTIGINYYDTEHIDYPDTFDIQKKSQRDLK